MTRRLVLFDIDGTLLLSGGAGRRSIHAAMLDVVGIDPSALDGVQFGGKTDPQIVAELFHAAGRAEVPSPDQVSCVIDRYLVHLAAELVANGALVEVLPGVRELLPVLMEDDRLVVGLLTGNVSRGAELKLRAVAIEPTLFRVGAYGSDHAVRAELPPIAAERATAIFGRRPVGAEIVIIGDTPADVTCGRGVGARSVAVATGGFQEDELRAAGADHVFGDLRDTARVRDAILGAA